MDPSPRNEQPESVALDQMSYPATAASRRTSEQIRNAVAVIMLIATVAAIIGALGADGIATKRTAWESVELSFAVGSFFALGPGLFLGALFDLGGHPFKALWEWGSYESAFFYFCVAAIGFVIAVVTVVMVNHYLTTVFSPSELLISLVAGSLTGATVVPSVLGLMPRAPSRS
jgi:hypothetical protein